MYGVACARRQSGTSHAMNGWRKVFWRTRRRRSRVIVLARLGWGGGEGRDSKLDGVSEEEVVGESGSDG